jgi:hypothetical protein
MKWRDCSVGLGVIALLAGAGGGCGELFHVGTTTTTGSGGTGTAAAGPGGQQSSSSGTGGAPACTAGACQVAGEYCNPASGACEACTELDRFQFGAPQPLGLTAAGYNALYPRVDGDTQDLYLDLQSVSSHLDQLAVAHATSGTPAWPTASLLPQLGGSHNDRGPLYLADPSLLSGLIDPTLAKSGMPVLLFDSDRMGSRLIFAVPLQGSTPSSLLLPTDATQASQVAMAMAAPTPRLFWVGDGAGSTSVRLLTGTASASVPPVSVTITLDSGCPAPLAGTPWVTPAGDLLLFTSPRYEASPGCAVDDATVTHLYQVPLDATGQPTGPATPVFADDASIDATPSLTPDQCTLLFARVDVSSSTAQIYAATRD